MKVLFSSRPPIAAAVALVLGGCRTPDLDTSAPAAFLRTVDPGSRGTAEQLARQAALLPACARPVGTLDSSATIVIDGSPSLVVRLPAGFVRSTARQPTPTLVRLTGPDGALVVIERDPATLAALGPAYSGGSGPRQVCGLPTPHGAVPAENRFFAGPAGVSVDPAVRQGAAANVPTVRVGGAPLSIGVYARTIRERTALLALAVRVRSAP